MLTEKKTVLNGYEVSAIVETLKNARLEYEELSRAIPWFVSETPELIEGCLRILEDNETKT